MSDPEPPSSNLTSDAAAQLIGEAIGHWRSADALERAYKASVGSLSAGYGGIIIGLEEMAHCLPEGGNPGKYLMACLAYADAERIGDVNAAAALLAAVKEFHSILMLTDECPEALNFSGWYFLG